MNSNSCRLAASIAVLLCCACSPTQLVGSKYVKSETVGTQGATLTVSAADSLELAGTQLVIPAGALSAETQITLELGLEGLVAGTDKGAGEIVHWGPSGTKFAKPVTMTLPYKLAAGETADRLFVQVVEADGTRFAIDRTLLVVDETAKTVRFDVDGFTGFQPGTNTPCMSNNDCVMGQQVCVNGVCKPSGCTSMSCQCTTNSQCAQGQVCTNGVCQACTTSSCTGQCGTINQCPMGQTCVNGMCALCMNGACSNTCSPNTMCPNGGVCLNGVCQQPACGPNAPCPMGQTCSSNGTCVSTQNGCGPMGVTCPTGQICVNGNCTTQSTMCGPNAPCPMNQTCTPNGVCASCNAMTGCPQCDAARPCASGQVCVNGTCQVCMNGACGACMSNSNCPMGQACVNGQCRTQSTMCGPNAPCPMGQTCNTLGQCVTTNACGPMGCPSGQSCVNGVCQSNGVQCGGVVCPMGYSCVMQQCQAPNPTGDAGTPVQCGGAICSGNQVCFNQQCQVIQCTTLQGCPNNYQCVMGFCR